MTKPKRRCYTAGPMSGKPQHNFPAFIDLAKALRKRDDVSLVVSPAEMDISEGFDPDEFEALSPQEQEKLSQYRYFLSRDIQVIARRGVNTIVVLPGWERSPGARVEVMFGLAIGCDIMKLRGDDLVNVVTTLERLEEALVGGTD